MQTVLLLATLLSSGEIKFPNECVITVTNWDSVSSWGGYDLDKPFLDTEKVSKDLSPTRYLFKKENETSRGARFIYRYWVPMDYCNKLEKEMLPAHKFSTESGSLSEIDQSIEIMRRDEKNNEVGFTVIGTDGNYLYLNNSRDKKDYCVSSWFSEAIFEILSDRKKQIEFDITNKSNELIQKFKKKN